MHIRLFFIFQSVPCWVDFPFTFCVRKIPILKAEFQPNMELTLIGSPPSGTTFGTFQWGNGYLFERYPSPLQGDYTGPPLLLPPPPAS